MCGICGQYYFDDQRRIDAEELKAMTAAIVHRGPDDEGFYASGQLGLGFRRLSIIDLAGGHQPMADAERKIWIVFNGEIYNFPQLRDELEKYGHRFQTRSDTEVIIHGYKQWGEEVFNHLNGMFGLAIWDEPKKKLIIARDAMGIKLVYYEIGKERVLFGSEIRSILQAKREKADVDPIALNLFLRYRYTPAPLTLYKGIRKLAAGTMLICENGAARHQRWYTFTPAPFNPMKKDDDAREELMDIYKRAVQRQLLSDVPVGLLLSGGMDSGLLLGLMNLHGEAWQTYTVGYGQSFGDDELDDAAKTAKIYNARHTSVLLDKKTFEESFLEIIGYLEEPVATSSIVPMFFVSKRARQDVKVALIGQGPDELFGGYTRHLGVRYGDYWRMMPRPLRALISCVIGTLPRAEALKRGSYSLSTDGRLRRYQHIFSIVPGETIDGLFRDGLIPKNAGDTVLEFWSDIEGLSRNVDEMGGFQMLEIRSSLPDELLLFGDKMSMAHSLEVRVPYLDREIVEYAERLSASFKIRAGTRKWVHRKVCRSFLPQEVLRRKKRGFATNVVDSWFRDSIGGEFSSCIADDSSMMYRFLRPDSVRRLLKEHIDRKYNHYKILFSLVCFEQWLRANHGALEH